MRNARLLWLATVLIAAVAIGCSGSDGAAGAKGETGGKGDPGVAGQQGAQGLPGKDGAQGAQGAQGDKGDKGDPGEAGAAGAAGAAGVDGNNGQNCSVKDNGDGTKTVECPGDATATTVTISDGKDGAAGKDGTSGLSTGTLTGTLTYKMGTGDPIPATGVSVNVSPDQGLIPAVSGSDGGYTLSDVPLGVYSVKFSGNGFDPAQTDGVVVTAGKSTTVAKTLTATNPLVLKAPVFTKPAGFGATAQLDITVTGGTEPYTFAWKAKTVPTTITLSNAAIKNPTFTTGTLAAVIASKKAEGLEGLERKGFVPVSAQQLTQMSYAVDCVVTDKAGFTKTLTVTVPPATLAQGNGIVPRNQIVIVSLPGNTAAQTLTKPASSTATLNEASSANPWFIPDVIGDYTVAGLKVNVGDFTSAAADCGVCHTGKVATSVDAKFKDWANSAHGNHYFKFMEYDDTGKLVWKNGKDGKPIPAPTADTTIFWTAPGAMTTFQFGLTGAEGSHYGANCVACHSTGFNLLAANGGMDDAQAAAGWVFPDLKAALGGDATTKAPVDTVWKAIPDSVKKYAGMQCESCHGPLGNHASSKGLIQPVGEYDIAACAVCHDKPKNHDRVWLFRQSKHSNLELAVDEGTVEQRGVSTSCFRCHAAQGFVQYLKNKDADPTQIVRPVDLPAPATCTPAPVAPATIDPNCPCTPAAGQTTCKGDPAFYKFLSDLGLNKAEVQPITCAACHDPHTTGLRIEGDTGPLGNGYQVKGAGAGAVCMVCHNTRNGQRGDFINTASVGGPHAPVQTDLFMGLNAYFVGAGGSFSKHAAVGDTCVGCHMKLHPDTLAPTNTNHTFAVDSSICKECHGEDVNTEALEGQFLYYRGMLETAFGTAFTAGVGGATPSWYALVPNKDTSKAPALVNYTVGPVSIVPSGRSFNLAMTFKSPVDDGNGGTTTTLTLNYKNVSLSNVVNDATTTKAAFATPLIKANGILAKANWNYWLVSSVALDAAGKPTPAANVIHNPSFVWDVLSATTTKLLASGGVGL